MKNLLCWLLGHKFVPINDHQQYRVMFCMRCAKEADAWVDPEFRPHTKRK